MRIIFNFSNVRNDTYPVSGPALGLDCKRSPVTEYTEREAHLLFTRLVF
jgi:hypothetical protein